MEQIHPAIAFVSDNFSRIILGFSVSLKNTSENVEKALGSAVETIREHHPQAVESTLVTDGGSENHAGNIETFLEENIPPEIRKVTALKAIKHSNSPVEAINKIIKRYLRHFKPGTYQQLIKVIETAVEDYNEKRPHGSLGGLTPMELYKDPSRKLDFREKMKRAKAARIEENRTVNCSSCPKW